MELFSLINNKTPTRIEYIKSYIINTSIHDQKYINNVAWSWIHGILNKTMAFLNNTDLRHYCDPLDSCDELSLYSNISLFDTPTFYVCFTNYLYSVIHQLPMWDSATFYMWFTRLIIVHFSGIAQPLCVNQPLTSPSCPPLCCTSPPSPPRPRTLWRHYWSVQTVSPRWTVWSTPAPRSVKLMTCSSPLSHTLVTI